MVSRLAARRYATYSHAPVHHHRKRKHGSGILTTGIIGVCMVMVGLTFVLLLRHERELTNQPPQPNVKTTAAALSPTKPAKTKSRRSREPNDKPRPNKFWDSGLPQVSLSDDSLSPLPFASGAKAQGHNPFESELPLNTQNTIDDLVFKRLEELKIKPAKLCSDEVFLRRIYIDVLGTLPTVEEARSFLDDPDPNKREKLIDRVLEQPEFADYWAMKWSDVLRVKAEFPIKLWPNAAQAYHRWIRTAIKNNMPYDQFARELLTTSGSNFRAPQVNFYRAVQNKEPKAIAQAVALTFLGERIENWPTERLDGTSAFFTQVGFKPTGEWKEEIVFFDRRKGKEKESLNKPLKAIFPNGVAVEVPPGEDPRQVFADWLVNEKNPWFARVAANRVWCWLLGRGVIEPPDDIRNDNPASNPALLNHLASELISAKYDLRQLYRLILNSQTYQLACIPQSDDPRAAENFAFYPVRRLDAEVLIDAICQLTGTSESYSSIIPEPYTFLPEGTRAIALPDGSITSSFLEMFGRPPRDTGLESERNNRMTAAQALHLLNSNHLRNKLKQGPGIEDLFSTTSDEDMAVTLYLAILSRRPTDEEFYLMSGMCGDLNGAREAAWALINSDEFLFRH